MHIYVDVVASWIQNWVVSTNSECDWIALYARARKGTCPSSNDNNNSSHTRAASKQCAKANHDSNLASGTTEIIGRRIICCFCYCPIVGQIGHVFQGIPFRLKQYQTDETRQFINSKQSHKSLPCSAHTFQHWVIHQLIVICVFSICRHRNRRHIRDVSGMASHLG